MAIFVDEATENSERTFVVLLDLSALMKHKGGGFICFVYLLFNVTFNGIVVIYVTAHRCAGGLKKFDLRSGCQRHRHSVGFFNVPVQAPTRDQPLYGCSEKPPLFDTLGIQRTYSHLKSLGSPRDPWRWNSPQKDAVTFNFFVFRGSLVFIYKRLVQ